MGGDLARQREIATDAVRAGAQRCLDDMWAEEAWSQLPRTLQARLIRANNAVEQRPHDERAAVVYQGRVAEAVAYLTSELQLGGKAPDYERAPF